MWAARVEGGWVEGAEREGGSVGGGGYEGSAGTVGAGSEMFNLILSFCYSKRSNVGTDGI